jgi:anti-anti-sigma factor
MTHGCLPGLQVAISYGRRGETTVELVGELDIASLSRLRRLLLALLEDCVRVAVDLRKLRFVDLPGVRLLVEVAAVAAGRDCRLEMEGASGQVARLLELTSARPLLPFSAVSAVTP